MNKAIKFLKEGHLDGTWDKVCHPYHHPYYANGVYDGGDEILLRAIEIAYLEGFLEGTKLVSDGNSKCDEHQARLKELLNSLKQPL